MLEQELAALEALGQALADGLLDDPRAGEADQRLGLGDVEVAEHGEAGRDPARGRVGEDGDVRQTGGAQTVQRTYQYDTWGQLTGGSDVRPFNNVDRARWKGALWLGPEVDLYYMRNRWYEPRTGRFISEDPIGVEGGIMKPNGAYVKNRRKTRFQALIELRANFRPELMQSMSSL